ncbi:MAG TPA: potassium channel family protein [Pyrinomonadaceae bacterium]|nr:potassium channel family protein [Pyrinomonadaceae bacterium]
MAFAIVAVCGLIHVIVIVIFAQFLLRTFSPAETIKLSRQALVLVLVFAVVTLLSLIEAGIWATFYYFRALFPDFETSFYFSLGTYSTIGYGDVVLPQRWRLLGGMEGISGVLLCGLSAAFVFAVLNALFQSRVQRSLSKVTVLEKRPRV